MIIQFILVAILVSLLVLGIINFSKTWGKWLTAAIVTSFIILTGLLIYKYFKKNSVPTITTIPNQMYWPLVGPVSSNMSPPTKSEFEKAVVTQPNTIVNRPSNFFLIDNSTISNSDIKKYLQENLKHDVLIFILEPGKITETIQQNNIYIPATDIITIDESRLFKYRKALGKAGKIGIPYIFEIRDVMVIIKVSKNIKLFSRVYNNIDRYKCFEIYSKIKNDACIPNKASIETVVGSSEYINETVIGFFLNQIFFGSYWTNPDYYTVSGKLNDMGDLGHSVFQIGYFQNPTTSVGYNVMEICDNTLDSLFASFQNPESDMHKIVFIYNGTTYNISSSPTKIFFLILQQINSMLLILKNLFSFNHGDLKGGNVFYKIDDSYLNVDYPLDGYNFSLTNTSKHTCKTNIRIKIADYGKASMTYNKTHYYCNDTLLDINKASQYVVDPEKLSVDSYVDRNGGKYLFDSTLPFIGLEMSMRHLACPYFLSADYYLLLTSLSLTSPYFFDFIKTNGIYAILDVDFDTKSKRPSSIVSAIKKLKGQYLKCSVMEQINSLSLSYLTS